MRFGSLFAGIGGLDLGLERAGLECVWQVEIEDYCTKVLEKHWPDVTKYKDVRDVGGQTLEPVDLIAGGFPCQPHSVAGKRRGAADDRNLWPEFIRVIRETKPRYILAENVPGIITTYLDTVLSDLEREDYTCTTLNIPAIAFGAPHRRERIFIVAYTVRQHCQKSFPRSEHDRETQAQETRSNHFEGDWPVVAARLLRMDDGIPSRLDRRRIEHLGNVVVPQVAEWIGRRIMEHDQR